MEDFETMQANHAAIQQATLSAGVAELPAQAPDELLPVRLPSAFQIGDRVSFSTADQAISSRPGIVTAVTFSTGKVFYDVDFPDHTSAALQRVDSTILAGALNYAEGRTHVAATDTEPERWL